MNLTENWKVGKIEKEKNYYIRFKSLDFNKKENVVHVGFLDRYNDFSVQYDTYGPYLIGHDGVIEVLAPCDYEELQRLEEYEKLYHRAVGEIFNIHSLLRECKKVLEELYLNFYGTSYGNKCEDILPRINATIGKEE